MYGKKSSPKRDRPILADIINAILLLNIRYVPEEHELFGKRRRNNEERAHCLVAGSSCERRKKNGMKFHSSYSEIRRAEKTIANINEMLQSTPPFCIVVHTNTKTFQRSFFHKQNSDALNNIKAETRSAINSIRVALEQAFYAVVSPHVPENKHREIQFPIYKSKELFDRSKEKGFATAVGSSFIDWIVNLKPYRNSGGNEILYFLHHLDSISKHRFPTPIGDYTKVTSKMLARQITDPTFPVRTSSPNITFTNCIFTWTSSPETCGDIGEIWAPSTCIFEKIIQAPISVALQIDEPHLKEPLIPFLYLTMSVVNNVLSEMKRFV